MAGDGDGSGDVIMNFSEWCLWRYDFSTNIGLELMYDDIDGSTFLVFVFFHTILFNVGLFRWFGGW